MHCIMHWNFCDQMFFLCVFLSYIESRGRVNWTPLWKGTGSEGAADAEEADQWAGDEDKGAEPSFRLWETRVGTSYGKMYNVEERNV